MYECFGNVIALSYFKYLHRLNKMAHFSIQNRRRGKLKCNFTFGKREKRKNKTECEEWKGFGVNERFACQSSPSDLTRRLSGESSFKNERTTKHTPQFETLPKSRKYEIAPPKPPRSMEKKIFICENPECQRKEELLGMIAVNFKACPACFTHYCSTKCRVDHWPSHKIICHYGRMKSYMNVVAELCLSEVLVQTQLSSLAFTGFYSKGRGCVMLVFASVEDARLFIDDKISQKPTYSSLDDIEKSGVRSNHQRNLVRLIKHYNPENEFILNVAIVAERHFISTQVVPRNKDPSLIEQFVIPLFGQKEGSVSKASRRLTL